MPSGPELASADLAIPGLGRARLIGRGGFGVVYSADDEQVGNRAAVKVLPPEIGGRDRARFERECETMTRVSGHPNVVRYQRSGYSDDGRPYVVMELVDGGTLADLVREEGGLGWERAVALILPIVDALGFAHRRGILHRDIKPQNILLTADGLTPKLADFGIASLEDQTNTVSTGIPASLAHTAPETLDGERDQRSDLYSLASTLYHVVAGRAPFSRPGDELTALVKRVLTAPVPLLDPDRPGEIDRFFAAALAKDPDLRPTSSRELRTWIGTVETGGSHRVPPPAALGGPATEPMAPVGTGSIGPFDTAPIGPFDTAPMARAGAGPLVPAVTGSVPIVGSRSTPSSVPSPSSAPSPTDGAAPDWSTPRRLAPGEPGVRELSPLASAAVVVGGGVIALAVLTGAWLAVRSGGSEPEAGVELEPGSDLIGGEDPASTSATPATGAAAPSTTAAVDIPDMVGRPRSQAEDALTRLDLRPEVIVRDLPVGDERDGTVLSQLPASTVAVAPGSTVELVVGRACTTELQTVEAKSFEYVPPHRGDGDQDFFGHGPEVALSVSLTLADNEAKVTIQYTAIETSGDLTEAGGTSEQVLVSVPPDTPIHSSSLGLTPGQTGPFFDDVRVLDGPESGVVEVADSQLVSRVTYVGDTAGPEAGTKTMVTVETRPFELSLVEPGCAA